MSDPFFKNKRVGVLMGGMSAEREVSLKSGAAIFAALGRLGYETVAIDVDSEVALALRRETIDVAFIALHGRYGEDGSIQGLLEIMQIPYTGSGLTASALAMDKIRSNALFAAHALPIPATQILTEKEADHFDIGHCPFGLPLVVKPVSEGSSVGVSLVKTIDKLQKAFSEAFRFGPQIMLQKYISGMEVHVGILDEKTLGGIQVKSKGAFYDYTAKYVPGMSTHIFPAPLPSKVYQNALDLALRAHQVLGCKGYSRVDLLIDEQMHPYILEVNTLPGMTETSLMPEMAGKNGIDFDQLVEKILQTAIFEHKGNPCPER